MHLRTQYVIMSNDDDILQAVYVFVYIYIHIDIIYPFMCSHAEVGNDDAPCRREPQRKRLGRRDGRTWGRGWLQRTENGVS